jgi:hypothetical protein
MVAYVKMSLEEVDLPIDVSNFVVDSRKRDRSLYPESSSYVVDFERTYRDVVSVELTYAIYSKFGDEDYVNLFVEELPTDTNSNAQGSKGAFTQLPLLTPKNEYTKERGRSIYMFSRPLSKLSKFTLRFRGYDGAYYPIREHMMRFEIRSLKLKNVKSVILTRETITAWTSQNDDSKLILNPAPPVIVSTLMTDAHALKILRMSRVDNIGDLVSHFKMKAKETRMGSNNNYTMGQVREAFAILAKKIKVL